MKTVAVTGAAGGLGRRVLPLVLADPSVGRVVALDRSPIPTNGDRVEAHRLDLARSDLAPLLEGVDEIVHLAFVLGEGRRADAAARVNLEGTRRLLAAASAAGVRHVVALSSATVYGAWPNNPIPLTEDAPLRPNPDVAYAVQKSYVEHLVADWADADLARTAAVLRPVTALAADGDTWVASALAEAASIRAGEDDPPAQFVHLDDLATAVDLARRGHLDGPYNVAPDGWIAGATVRALHGAGPRLRLPDRLARAPGAHPVAVAAGARLARPAVVRDPPVRRGERAPALGRVGARPHQRAGLRGRHRGQVVDDAQPEATPGAGPRRRGGRAGCDRDAGRPRHPPRRAPGPGPTQRLVRVRAAARG